MSEAVRRLCSFPSAVNVSLVDVRGSGSIQRPLTARTLEQRLSQPTAEKEGLQFERLFSRVRPLDGRQVVILGWKNTCAVYDLIVVCCGPRDVQMDQKSIPSTPSMTRPILFD